MANEREVYILYLTAAYKGWGQRWQVTNIVDAKYRGQKKLMAFGEMERLLENGWRLATAWTTLTPKEIMDGYWFDILDTEQEGQLLALEHLDKNSTIVECEAILAEVGTTVKESPTMEKIIRAVVENKPVTIDSTGKVVTIDGMSVEGLL